MATSSSVNFELDVASYVEEAFERCGLEVRTGYDLKTARRSLNLLLADWANRGLNQWTIEQTSITLASDIGNYPGGSLTMTVGASGSFTVGETITGGTSSATASITSLPSSTSMAITIPSGTFSNGETLTGGTSAATTTLSAAVDLTTVQKTIDVLSVVITRDSTDYGLTRLSRSEYLNIPNKAQSGRPSQFFLDRQVTPNLKLWPVPENNTDIVKFDRLVRMDDADDYTNTLQIPFRFYPCLAAGLAYYLAIKRAPQRIELLKAIYEEEFNRAREEDRDRASLKIAPSFSYYGG
jgi:hypothetical protein|tara:strand:- start:1878 stop:2762 length:885 start_codon:yes stop_codon:yes gene_type:complete